MILEIFPNMEVTVGTFMQHLNGVSVSAVHALYYVLSMICYQNLLKQKKYKKKKKKKKKAFQKKKSQINTSVTR